MMHGQKNIKLRTASGAKKWWRFSTCLCTTLTTACDAFPDYDFKRDGSKRLQHSETPDFKLIFNMQAYQRRTNWKWVTST